MQKDLIQYIEDNKEKHYRMAYSYVQNQEDALDIVQDTIIKALRNQSTLKNKEYMGTWFCRILINTCKDHLKRQSKCISLEEVDLGAEAASDKDQVMDMEEAMNQLTPNEKAIVLMRYYEDLELKEIASVTQQNLSTVKSTLYRTIKKLRDLLESK